MRRILFIVALVFAVGIAVLPSQEPSAKTNAAAQTQRQEVTVYVTDTGERYHVSSCRYLRYSNHPISLREAKRRGYTPCKVCQPPK